MPLALPPDAAVSHVLGVLDSYEEVLVNRVGQHYILHCSMVVALGNHAAGKAAATRFVGSGRNAWGLSQTFSLPDQLGRVFGPGFF